jgi:hypothetical protein
MAKQTFTTGQVLTAAQMTSLQQTAMGGGAASTKTVSYVLVAADAGTTIQMSSASATTVTVNTSLFAAGDTVTVQNIGAGATTVTAGTATVTTSGSLVLGQWEGGILYFTSASAAIFFDYTQTGAASPLTTKGDVWGYSTLDARIPIGTNNQVLTADSTQALGLKWATPAGAAASWSLAGSGSLNTLTTRTISGLSADKILVVLDNALQSGGSGAYNRVIVNGLTTSIYKTYGQKITPAGTYAATILANYGTAASAGINLCLTSSGSAPSSGGAATISGCSSTGYKQFQSVGSSNAAAGNSQESYVLQGIIEESTAITSVAVTTNATWSGGNMYVYVSN